MIEASDVHILTDPVDQATCPKCSHMIDVQGLPSFSSVVCATCGYELAVPARLGHFLLLKIIGMGGMGGVYRAHDDVLNRDVAIKVMRKSLGDNATFSENFLREAQAAARINHPNIVQIYSFGKEKGQPYIVMELVSGGGMDKLMEGGKPLDQTRVMRIAEQVADGLRHASEEGMVHGDVKPENILLADGKIAKLVDFGLASVSGTASNEIWGTPLYIAPEKVKRQKTDHRADIYSLGGTLYHALAGRPPFDGPDANAVVRARFSETLKPLTEVRPDIDPGVSAIISRMLLNEPALRYPTYGSLLSDIRGALDRLGPVESAPPTNRKIVLRRKGGGKGSAMEVSGAAAAKPAVAVAPAMANPASSNKKIVIGRGVMVASGHQSTPIVGDEAATGAHSNPAADAIADDPARRMRMVKWVIALILFGILAVAGGIFGLLRWKQTRVRNSEREHQRQVQRQQHAVAALTGVADRARQRAGQCAAEVEKGTALATNLANQALELIPETLHPYLVPPRPEPPPEVAEEAAPSASSGATRAAPASRADAEKLAKAAAAVAAAGLPLTPENIATFARQLDASASGAAVHNPEKGDEPESAPAEEGANDGEDASPVAGTPLAESELPPPVQRIRAVFRAVYELERAADAAAALADQVALAIQAPDILRRPLEAVQALHADLTRLCDEAETRSPLADVGRITRKMREDHAAAVKLLDEIQNDRERQAKEARERAAAEEAERERQRAEQARRDRIQSELNNVTAAETMSAEAMRNLEFRQANRIVRNLEERIETEEGKAALALAYEKIARIEAFYQFLGAAADGVPNPGAEGVESDRPMDPFVHPIRGWTVEQSDIRGITVGGKTATWQEADKDFVLRVMIIRHLLKDPKQVNALRFRFRIQQYINAALFLETFIVNSPAVKEMAVSFARSAVELFPRSREEIDRLLPGLLKAED